MVPADAFVGPDPDDLVAWESTRLSLAYIRDTVEISRGEGELLDPLIFTTILDANMVPVNRDPELSLRYGGDESAPDELRRPVSINAIAQSLRLPFETVRRRVNGMVARGECVLDAGGVVAPYAAVSSPAYVAIQRARYDRARRLYQALRAIGAVPHEPAPRPTEPAAYPLIRAANRALSVYMLRASSDLIALTGDALSSLILLELILANTRTLPTAQLPAWAADPVRRAVPVRIATLAQALHLSPETARRHILKLEKLGLCERLDPTVVATAPPALWPELAQLMAANLANLQRLFAALRQLDVLAAWDTPDAAWPAAVA